MGTTKDFIKLRSTETPKVGEWNINYKTALAKAKKEGKFIVTAWTNGDACGDCVQAEKCMMTTTFKNWLKKQDAYFVFQCSADKDKGKTLQDWIYAKGGLKHFPGFRITLYDAKGKIVVDKAIEGNDLRDKKTGATGAKNMVAAIDAIFAKKPSVDPEPTPEPTPEPEEAYVTRLNESLTTKQVNKVLDAIDKNDGYCPCQPKGEGTKCHCEDYIKNKKIGQPCICKIYVKQKPVK